MFDSVKFDVEMLKHYLQQRSEFLKRYPGAETYWFNESINYYLNDLGGLAARW